MAALLRCHMVLGVLFFLNSASSSSRPNIVVFLVDDLGWSDVSYNGAEYSTPNIDALASESLRLSRYYVQSSCSPSRAALLTGRYPHRMGLAHTVITNGFDIAVPVEYKTLADELRSAGYGTHMTGKWDIGMSKWRNTPTFRGFDSFVGYYGAFEDHLLHGSPAVPGVSGTSVLPYQGVDLRNGTKAVTDRSGTFGDEIFISAALEIIGSHKYQEKPMFLYVSNQNVHAPLQAPGSYVDRCSGITTTSRKMKCAMAKVCDEHLKQVVDALQDIGQWNNTVFLFMTDNGGQTSSGSSNWPLRAGKMTVYEGGVRGLAFIHGPSVGIPQGTSTDALIHTVDWLPTLVTGIAGKPLQHSPPNSTDAKGSSLVPVDGHNVLSELTGGDRIREEVLLQFDPPFRMDDWYQASWPGQVALISGSWKLIIGTPLCTCSENSLGSSESERCDDGWFRKNGSAVPPPAKQSWTQLYHLGFDPNEKMNLAIFFPILVKKLRSRIASYAYPTRSQIRPDFDPRANPARHGGVWTPWLGL